MTFPKTKNPNRTGWFYGWVIVAVSFITLTIVFGVRLSFTVFFVALIEEFDWLRADTSLIFSTSMLVFAATSTMAGMTLDRWGVRRTFGLGGVLLAMGLLLSSQIQSFWQLVVVYGGIASLGITILGLGPQASLIARWFRLRRGLAIGIAFAGTGIGALLFTPGIEYLISEFGWRSAYLVLAMLALAAVPLNFFLLRLNPGDMQMQPDGAISAPKKEQISLPEEKWQMKQVIRTPSFWLLMLSALGAIGPVRMLTVHQLAIIVDAGFTRSFAARVIGSSGAITAFAFILFGMLSDRIGRRVIYVLGSLALLIAMLILNGIQASPPQGIWLALYAISLGFGEGSRASLVTALASDLFPGNARGAIIGTIGAAFGLGAAFFPWLAGRLYDFQGTYSTVFYIAGFTVFVSALTLFFAPRFKKRMLCN